MSALARSVSGVASAIRNPLLSIREYLGQLPDRCDQPEFIDEVCRFVPSQVDRVNAAIGDLAFFAKPRSPEPEAFDLAACVGEVLARAGDEADSRGIIIRADLADVKAFADKAQVTDAVYRVISNAIACSRHRSEVEVHLRIANEAFAEIEVCGYIPDLGTQWERIERGEQSRMDAAAELFFSARPGDSALSMAVAYRILKLNGGLLAADATHEGACVKMTIPRLRLG
jgi:signal transduction histidine kinase